jgi:hypothetical protein
MHQDLDAAGLLRIRIHNAMLSRTAEPDKGR